MKRKFPPPKLFRHVLSIGQLRDNFVISPLKQWGQPTCRGSSLFDPGMVLVHSSLLSGAQKMHVSGIALGPLSWKGNVRNHSSSKCGGYEKSDVFKCLEKSIHIRIIFVNFRCLQWDIIFAIFNTLLFNKFNFFKIEFSLTSWWAKYLKFRLLHDEQLRFLFSELIS